MTDIRADGRWDGRLTQRPLPEDDSIEKLTRDERAELAEQWQSRGASERRVGEAFAVIGEALTELRAPVALVDLATRAVDDENRHAELSRVVASRFAGRPLESPARLPLNLPEHRGAPRRLKLALYVTGQSCFNETFASVVLEETLAAATAPLAKAALRELLADEVDHARIGWGYLATLNPVQRVAVSKWLLALGQANVRMWRTTGRVYASSPRVIAHGAMSRDILENALLVALRDLVIPGLQRLGFDAEALAKWAAAGAPTEDIRIEHRPGSPDGSGS